MWKNNHSSNDPYLSSYFSASAPNNVSYPLVRAPNNGKLMLAQYFTLYIVAILFRLQDLP